MMTAQNKTPQAPLPIPDIPYVGLTTHDAEDPVTTHR